MRALAEWHLLATLESAGTSRRAPLEFSWPRTERSAVLAVSCFIALAQREAAERVGAMALRDRSNQVC